MVIEKIAYAKIDIDAERKRIRKCFGKRKDAETKNHLLALMDYVEAGEWKLAAEQLESDWWKGRDQECECPRVEFIGMLWKPEDTPDLFSNHQSYIELIYSFINYPNNYRVV